MFSVNELLKATKGKIVWGNADLRVKGISIDSRTIGPGECFMAIKGDNFDGHDFIEEAIKKGATCIIAKHQTSDTRHQKVNFIEVKDTIKALGEIARFHRQKFNIPVIAVTGSNGKTTTKEMLAWVLAKRFKVLKNEGTKNNHIGLPMTLLNLDGAHEIAVLEVGTNHFGEVKNLSLIAHPNIGVITNIGPAHLEFLRNLEGVFCEKYTLIENLKSPCLAILNADDNLLKRRVAKRFKKPFIAGFGIKHPADFSAKQIKRYKDGLEFLVNKKYKFTLRTPGVYNIYNALACIAVARIFGIEYKDMMERLARFKFPFGRLNLLTLKKVRFIDDTYNSNPLSLIHALDALSSFKVKGRRILVMGDMMELGGAKTLFHSQAGRKVAQACDAFIAVGRLSRLTAKVARACGFDASNIFSCENSLQARDILFNKISPGSDDVVLVKGSRAMKMEKVLEI